MPAEDEKAPGRSAAGRGPTPEADRRRVLDEGRPARLERRADRLATDPLLRGEPPTLDDPPRRWWQRRRATPPSRASAPTTAARPARPVDAGPAGAPASGRGRRGRPSPTPAASAYAGRGTARGVNARAARAGTRALVRTRTLLALLVLAPWLLWTLVRLLALDRVPLLAQAVAFTPYVALTTPLPFIVALVLLRPRVAAAAVVPAVVLGALVVPRALPGPRAQPDPGGMPLRVMTLNLLGGAADPRAVAELVAAERVDVLSLQEVTPQALERLDRAGLARSLPRRVDGSAPGGTGTAVLSRLPITDPVRREDRSGLVLTAATVRPSQGRPVDVVAVHPPPPLGGADHATWRRLLRALPPAGRGRVRILAGDFNATLDHRELRRVLDRGYVDAADVAGEGLGTTWPVGRRWPPEITIDHVLADRRSGIGRVVRRSIPGSDHRAVLADVRTGR